MNFPRYSNGKKVIAAGDMIKYPLYGANLHQFIGQPITDNLVSSMKASISQCLTEDLFLSGQNIVITDIREGGIVTGKQIGRAHV